MELNKSSNISNQIVRYMFNYNWNWSCPYIGIERGALNKSMIFYDRGGDSIVACIFQCLLGIPKTVWLTSMLSGLFCLSNNKAWMEEWRYEFDRKSLHSKTTVNCIRKIHLRFHQNDEISFKESGPLPFKWHYISKFVPH